MDTCIRFQVERNGCWEFQQRLQFMLEMVLKENAAIEANVTKLTHFLNDDQWKGFGSLGQTTSDFEPPNDFPSPYPMIISYDHVILLEDIFMNSTGKLNYLKHLIPHFNIENVLFGERRYAPIHYAAEALDEEFLGWLLSQVDANGRALIDVNLRNKDRKTALYMLCEKYDKCTNELASSTEEQRASRIGNREKIVKLINQLLQAGADFNIYSDPNQLPFDLLFKHHSNDIALQQLMDHYVSQSNRLIAYNVCLENESNGRLIMFYPEDQGNRAVCVTTELLELLLQFGDLENFNRHWNRFSVEQNNVKKVIELVLQVAVARKLGTIVGQIITKANVLIFEKHEREPKFQHRVELKGLLITAILAGNLEIIELLMLNLRGDHELMYYDPLLALTIHKAHFTRKTEKESKHFLKCAKYLINSNAVSLHKTTDTGNTPLHLAAMYGFKDIVLMLLKRGCGSLGVCNQAYLTPLECASYDFWKTCFDRLIKVVKDKSGACKAIDFDTICLTPPSAESNAAVTQKGLNKWTLIRNTEEANILSDERVVVNEMTPLLTMAESNELKRLLMHPVIYTFIIIQLNRMSNLHFMKLFLTMCAIGVIGCYSLSVCNVAYTGCITKTISMVLSEIVLIIMLIPEFLQLYLLRRSYVTIDNLIDVVNIVVMHIVIWDGCRSILSSLVMLVLVLRMLFMITEPFWRLSTIMYMFKKVAINFIESLLLFLPLIGAFVFAFYLANNSLNESDAFTESNRTYVTNVTTQKSDINKFSTLLSSVIKTLVMTTGELDAGGLDLSGDKVLLFFVFLFTAPLVILNLMNGLAVSDISAIRQQSELISISKKVMRLERIERMRMKCKSQRMNSWFPKPFLKHHSSKIRVQIGDLGKILVCRKQPKQPASRQSITESYGETLLLDEQNLELEHRFTSREKMFSLPWFAPLFCKGTGIVVDLIILRLTSFVTLDAPILAEALKVIGFKSIKSRSETEM